MDSKFTKVYLLNLFYIFMVIRPPELEYRKNISTEINFIKYLKSRLNLSKLFHYL
jgi:hypothetical protein